jgi:D-beta-D-heptose 7-phosphate kinase/D-beta-D-heptose 1-phosphate adenosyltransferase
MKTICVSGGFDPIHIGHVRMIEKAADLGNVVVILNTDEWLLRKKGFFVMPWEQRREILLALRSVHNVIIARDDDDTVCETLKYLKPDYFANGGDRTTKNTPEKKLCKELGITMLWGMGGKKIASSSELVKRANGKI